MDQLLEHISALTGKQFQAFLVKIMTHITAHLNFYVSNIVRNNPAVMGAIQKYIAEHISLMAQEQIQLSLEMN